ncbi:pyrimidine dimer DNA glycosylase/endonuclease V [Vulcanisaeta sp. JCM 16159]|uniref:pyrimidine dimer DNA glycosylase/endonuclease V n=1 Tax=Vulcanisaeta sp. JCM 16159 TaxID=1295371 RepID=UPI0006D0A997|nr:pyrimidine dimer DNA glycosylase/endonuclease V [Vulcanisaeta sp. JCM 16159]
MQVFRPYIDHGKSAGFLDDLRLGKQRVEAKQVILAILRKLGILRDGRTGWLNHPIVLMYFNNGHPYLDDLIKYFYSVIDEWERRGFVNNISLSDVEPLINHISYELGTPVTEVMAREYRRVLLLKDPCYYVNKLSTDELLELLNTEPVYFKGVNTWIRDVYDSYIEFMSMLRRGQVSCRSIFPRR